jgi:hypothetical protein
MKGQLKLYQYEGKIKNFNLGKELMLKLALYTLTEVQKGDAEAAAHCPNLTIN